MPMLTPMRVLWPTTTILADGLSFTISFIRNLMLPVRGLSTKWDDAAQSKFMVNFSEPGVSESARNE